jgi:hypothetical protein
MKGSTTKDLLEGLTMSTLVERYRNRRTARRRTRAIEDALSRTPSETMRQELLAIMSRYE